VGAAVLIRALEPLDGIELMRERRGLERLTDLCSGPGKLTQALGIGLSLNASSLVDGPIEVLTREPGSREPRIVIGERVGITKAADLLWRFCDADSRHVSRPWPAAMRATRAA
jgi:DNA-3-methyladenine glycosylase